MFNKKIWVIEDSPELQDIYTTLFSDAGQINCFKSFEQFSKEYSKIISKPDILIVDIMLEDGNFFDTLNKYEISLESPFIIVSGIDKLESFEIAYSAGAADYLLKPLNFNEVKAKVIHHLSAAEERTHECAKFLETLELDIKTLTNRECKIIESFHMREDCTLHRSELNKILWKNLTIHPNTLDVHIYNLRKKLKDSSYAIKSVGSGLFQFYKRT
jgi:DNA-binding response OmpR family regulator